MLCNEIISSWAIIHDLNELSNAIDHTYANVYLRRVSNGKLIRRAKIVRRAK